MTSRFPGNIYIHTVCMDMYTAPVLKAGHSGVWCLLVCLFACLFDCLICGCFTMFRMWVGVCFVLLFLNILI